ncbi:MAG: hypothetical protein JW778_02100 [Candidatus Altiarchaeota archaeon]|nr:hypothetical protein [Candidatus Altiarchaeota archaeon]
MFRWAFSVSGGCIPILLEILVCGYFHPLRRPHGGGKSKLDLVEHVSYVRLYASLFS